MCIRDSVSGETFYLLGRGVRLSVEKNVRDTIFNDGVYLHLQTKDPDDFSKNCLDSWNLLVGKFV